MGNVLGWSREADEAARAAYDFFEERSHPGGLLKVISEHDLQLRLSSKRYQISTIPPPGLYLGGSHTILPSPTEIQTPGGGVRAQGFMVSGRKARKT